MCANRSPGAYPTSQRKPVRNSDLNIHAQLSDRNLFVKNIPPKYKERELRELFQQFGAIVSCIVMTDVNEVSLHYGFVHFKEPSDANEARFCSSFLLQFRFIDSVSNSLSMLTLFRRP